ncbi:7,8-dihydro-8-oxoguanine triphosphatase-like [Orussus abietinus]|uniref:7,8-dihydro-8-oxoguanine triphosphatase-like n=1 Tax=Orussus abietinus TaxID=222816 RepID=UPI000625BC5D|nr:7,8-dihydro-8-oxoguanine triphosphatase-like [Orussus abietinus]XP_012276184.1 7,8-dihydro-8-oxoguanine triphosphatase-like [Orussus abietinus]
MTLSTRVYSLVFVREASRILLGLKKRGFGEGKWNGFGGKVEPNETVVEGAVRELKEECGLLANSLKYKGVLKFQFKEDPTLLEVHVFDTYDVCGELTESDEMRPKWYNLQNIPFDKMWPDDAYWFPYMLRGELFKGYFLYQGEKILEQDIKPLTEVPEGMSL